MNTAPVQTAPVIKEFMCEYCNTVSTLTIDGDESIVCPVCGAPVPPEFIKDATAAVNVMPAYSAGNAGAGYGAKRKKNPIIKAFITVAVIYFAIIVVYRAYHAAIHRAFFNLDSSRSSPSVSTSAPVSTSSAVSKSTGATTAGNGDSVYVPALSRTVYWNDENESFYDKPTDCYFFWNDEIDYPDWQYWYEDISSDYGDYGWMEWDGDEGCWYIETGEGEWEVLPSEYDTSELWHF